MKGSREVVEMEDTGEIYYINYTVLDDNLVPVDWQEIQYKDLKEIEDDTIRE